METTHAFKTAYNPVSRAFAIPPAFTPNAVLATHPNNTQHNELKTKYKQAKMNGGMLHLSSFNIDVIFPEIYSMTFLIRLDLSHNNIRVLEPAIGQLVKLKQLWLNNNPLRAVPVELCQCEKLQELDLKDTEIERLPRELASLRSLVYLSLDRCKLKPSLEDTYSGGVLAVHRKLNRKDDRKLYKQKMFNRLSEWIYPSEPKQEIQRVLNEVFYALKDASTDMLRKLYRNCQIIFPPKFYQIDAEQIRDKLDNVYKEWNDREETAQIELRLKFYFRDEPLADVAKLASDLYQNIPDSQTLEELFRYKKYVFIHPFKELTANLLLENLENYKDLRRRQKATVKEALLEKLKEIFKKESKTVLMIGGVTQEIILQFHAHKFQQLRKLLREGKPVFDFDKKIFVVLSDTEIVEQFCAMFSHKPSAALKIKYLTPASQGEDDNNE